MKTDVTIHMASEVDLDALVRLAVAFRDHVGHMTPSAEEFCTSMAVLLHDASAEFLLASTPTGAAVGYVQGRVRGLDFHPYMWHADSPIRREMPWS
jgi:hypothetical protein